MVSARGRVSVKNKFINEVNNVQHSPIHFSAVCAITSAHTCHSSCMILVMQSDEVLSGAPRVFLVQRLIILALSYEQRHTRVNKHDHNKRQSTYSGVADNVWTLILQASTLEIISRDDAAYSNVDACFKMVLNGVPKP